MTFDIVLEVNVMCDPNFKSLYKSSATWGSSASSHCPAITVHSNKANKQPKVHPVWYEFIKYKTSLEIMFNMILMLSSTIKRGYRR